MQRFVFSLAGLAQLRKRYKESELLKLAQLLAPINEQKKRLAELDSQLQQAWRKKDYQGHLTRYLDWLKQQKQLVSQQLKQAEQPLEEQQKKYRYAHQQYLLLKYFENHQRQVYHQSCLRVQQYQNIDRCCSRRLNNEAAC